MAFNFRVGRTTVHNIIKETYEGIWCALNGSYPRHPTTEEDWKEIGRGFFDEWDYFPNCQGTLDGKHIAIECPEHSGSKYFNYKGFISIALMAIRDVKYRFTLVDVGNYGKDNDAQIFRNSLSRAFLDDHMTISLPQSVNGYSLPNVIVSDEISMSKP